MFATRVRSAATALVGAAAELSLVTLLRSFGTPAVIVFSVVQVVGAAITFILNKQWVFGAAGSGGVAAEISRSLPVVAGAFVLNTALPVLGMDVAAFPAIVAYLVSQAFVYLTWSFPLNRRWVFPVTRSCVANARARGHVA